MSNLWRARTEALDYLKQRHPSRLDVLERTFDLIDACIDAYEADAGISPYSRACALALLKAKNYAVGAYSLVLDGLAQEGGAVARPMIEYAEILAFLRVKPDMAGAALKNELPKAGERAKAIDSMYREFRDYLNRNASHSSFEDVAVAHLVDGQTQRLRKLQVMAPGVIDRNARDLVVQLHLLLREAVLSLERTGSPQFSQIADSYDRLKARMIDVYGLSDA